MAVRYINLELLMAFSLGLVINGSTAKTSDHTLLALADLCSRDISHLLLESLICRFWRQKAAVEFLMNSFSTGLSSPVTVLTLKPVH